MTRVSVGFFIRRTWKNCPPGKTLCAQAHRIYPTREEAADALAFTERHGYPDSRFDYDIAEAWMHVEEDGQ